MKFLLAIIAVIYGSIVVVRVSYLLKVINRVRLITDADWENLSFMDLDVPFAGCRLACSKY